MQQCTRLSWISAGPLAQSDSISGLPRLLTAFFAATGHRVFLRTVAPAHFLRFRLELTGGSISFSLRRSHCGLGIARRLCGEAAERLRTLLIVIESLLYEGGLRVHKTLRRVQIVVELAVPKVEPSPVEGQGIATCGVGHPSCIFGGRTLGFPEAHQHPATRQLFHPLVRVLYLDACVQPGLTFPERLKLIFISLIHNCFLSFH